MNKRCTGQKSGFIEKKKKKTQQRQRRVRSSEGASALLSAEMNKSGPGLVYTNFSP